MTADWFILFESNKENQGIALSFIKGKRKKLALRIKDTAGYQN